MLLLALSIGIFALLCLYNRAPQFGRAISKLAAGTAFIAISAVSAFAQEPAHKAGSEADLILPDLSKVFFFGVNGRSLLLFGLIVCALGMLFGLMIYKQ